MEFGPGRPPRLLELLAFLRSGKASTSEIADVLTRLGAAASGIALLQLAALQAGLFRTTSSMSRTVGVATFLVAGLVALASSPGVRRGARSGFGTARAALVIAFLAITSTLPGVLPRLPALYLVALGCGVALYSYLAYRAWRFLGRARRAG
jgi:hypothetical protein